MANCTIADVQALVLGPGVRFAPAEHERVQEAIDATAVEVADDAGYVELMEAKRANAEAAAGKLINPPKAKAKAKAKAK